MNRICLIVLIVLSMTAAQAFGMAGKVASVADRIKVTLSVVKKGHGAILKIDVENISKNRIELVFPTWNTNEFIIKDAAGKLVWQWTKDRLFKEKPVRVLIEPGKTVTYTANWDLSDMDGKVIRPGKYQITGVLPVLPTSIPTETRTIEILDEDLKIAGGYIITGRIDVAGEKVAVSSDDGTTYILANELNIFRKLNGKYIRVFAPLIDSIPNSKDKKMTVDNYKIFDTRPVE